MAATVKRDLENRIVEVNRVGLLSTLKKNREIHIQDYEEAMQGYKEALLSKVNEAFEQAKVKLQARHEKQVSRIEALTDDQIKDQRDCITLMDALHVEMQVPRSYAAEYDAAIAITEWDVSECLKLTHAEFACFVRDEWDWKSSFDAVSMLYKVAPLS